MPTAARRCSRHCIALSVNAVHESWNRHPHPLAHADRVAEAIDLISRRARWRRGRKSCPSAGWLPEPLRTPGRPMFVAPAAADQRGTRRLDPRAKDRRPTATKRPWSIPSGSRRMNSSRQSGPLRPSS
jgi:hypothetical protein